MSDDDEELDELTGAWALDAVDDDERAAIARRLHDDEALRDEADELREVAGLLGEVVAERPPADLRAAILAEVAETPQEPVTSERPPVIAASADAGVVVPLRRRRLTAGLAAAAVVLVALVGVAVVVGDTDGRDEIAAVTDDPAAVVVELVGELGAVRVVVSEDEGAAVVLADAVAVPERGRTYQLWTIGADGGIEPSEVFRPDDDGRVEVRLDGVARATGFAISEEPAGGSLQPTGDILAISA